MECGGGGVCVCVYVCKANVNMIYFKNLRTFQSIYFKNNKQDPSLSQHSSTNTCVKFSP